MLGVYLKYILYVNIIMIMYLMHPCMCVCVFVCVCVCVREREREREDTWILIVFSFFLSFPLQCIGSRCAKRDKDVS